MYMKSQLRRVTWILAITAVVSTIVGYAAVAASTHMRPPTVVVSFSIVEVFSDLSEKADSEAKLRTLVTKITDERTKRLDSINAIKESIESAADADLEVLLDQLEQQTLEAISYQRFAGLQIDNERSLMFRDIYLKIKEAVAQIAEENGYDIVLVSDVDREIGVNPNSELSRELQVMERIGLQRAIYTSTQTDITDQIVTHMNLEWDKRSNQ